MSASRIVLILTDTQRADMVGCYANTGLLTPNLDQLAKEGVRFDKAYCCSPVCGPSRAAILTGLYPHSNGVLANSMPLNAITKTLGQRMQDQGYRTAFIGKWHLDGGDYFGDGYCPDGWDPNYWYDIRCYLDELSEQDRINSRQTSTNRNPDFTKEFTVAHRCSSKAIDFLSEHFDEEFLLVLSYDEPHHPYLCPPEFEDMYKDYEFPKSPNTWDDLENKPEHQRVWAQENKVDRDDMVIRNPAFFGCNSFVDHEIGRVLHVIDRLTPDALVLYTSDHGDMLLSHGLTEKGPAMYEEITRVPFIIRWPHVTQAGAVDDSPVSHIDIVPTILDAAGLPTSKRLPGTSLVKRLSGDMTETHDAVFLEYHRFEIDLDGFGGFQPARCIFDDRYKLVVNLLTSDELYDLREDPFEVVNIINATQYKVIRNDLHDRLLSWMNDTRDPFRGYYWERRPWRNDARDATWHYTGMVRQREPDEGERRQLDYATGLEIKESVRKKAGRSRTGRSQEQP